MNENIILRGIVNNDTINGDPRPLLTGGIYSYNKFAFQYGRIEVRAKLDPAHGAWPAIWMLSEKDIYPDQNNGEMDIMERLNHDSFAYQTTHNHATITLKQETPKKFNTGKIDPSGGGANPCTGCGQSDFFSNPRTFHDPLACPVPR